MIIVPQALCCWSLEISLPIWIHFLGAIHRHDKCTYTYRGLYLHILCQKIKMIKNSSKQFKSLYHGFCFVLFFKLLLLSLLCIFPSLALGRRVTHFVMSITLVSVLVASALLNDYQLWFLSVVRPVFLSHVALNHVQLHAYMLHTYSCILCEHLNIYIACTNINVLVWRRTKRVYKI